MLSAIVIDDEAGAVEILARYVEKTPALELAGSFRDPVDALGFLAGHTVDLIFLDIDMPDLDGMKMAELIREKDIQVIFCTAYSEFAVESYEKEAVDYLLKPVSYERFLQAVKKAQKARSREKTALFPKKRPGEKIPAKRIYVKSGSRLHRIELGKLLYMEKKEHYVIFHISVGEPVLSRMNMDELMAALPAGNFIRIHRSYVVALDKIETVEKQAVVIRNRKIPIGESYRDDLFKRIPYSGH